MKANPAYKAVKEQYKKYIDAYVALNNGSTKGATPFQLFYMERVYINRYSDPRSLLRLGYG